MSKNMGIGISLQQNRRYGDLVEVPYVPPGTEPPPPPPDPAFVILVKTDNTGTSASNQMTLPLTGTYDIDWGDGVVQTLTGAQTHTYPAPGLYTIRITGGLTRISFSNVGDRLKLLDIQNWGNIAWTIMQVAFQGCGNLIVTATDSPNFSVPIILSNMFQFCYSFNSNINHWDMSNVTNLGYMFAHTTLFNQPLDNWDVSNVTHFGDMFTTTQAFNQEIGMWNMASATNISWMFSNSKAFNKSLGGWNMSKVINANYMFNGAVFTALGYGPTLIGWAAQILKPSLAFIAGTAKYPTDGTGNPLTDAAAARAKIIADFGWTITDGGPA